MDILFRNKAFVLLILMLINTGCNFEGLEVSQNDIQLFCESEEEIEDIRKEIMDSIKVWKANRLEGYNWAPELSGKIDTLICLNNSKDKLVTALLVSSKAVQNYDGITLFYGAKLNNRWYFFEGPYFVMHRGNANKPQSFKELSDLAYKNIFRHYLKRNWKGELEINEDFFSDMTSSAYYGYAGSKIPVTKEDWDKRYLEIVKENWSKRDTTDYTKK